MELTRELTAWADLAWQDWQFRRRQPPGWKRMRLPNVPVAPVEELLMRWAGGSVWRGGPQAMPWHRPCAALHHYRGEARADDPALTLQNADQWPVVSGRLFWCGPIVNHFGHQLGEFGGRVLLASLDTRPGHLLFLHPEGDRDLGDLLPWQQAWIQFLNPTGKPVLIRGGSFRARDLVVVPQQQRLGCAPTPRHLLALTARGRHLQQRPLNEVIVLSRSQFAKSQDESSLRGSIAGEAAFDRWMASQGAKIVHPEQLPFNEQLELLHNARRLIVAEGSALHALELIGRQPQKDVVVMARRPLWPGMDRPLRSRFPRLIWLDAVHELHWLEPSNPRVKGVARLDWPLVLRTLCNRFGWLADTGTVLELTAAADAQLTHLSQTLPMQCKVCDADSRQTLRAGGW